MVLHAVLQGFVNWAVESPLQPDVVDVHAPCGPVLVAFRVPACALAFGEHLRVVGGCAELGGWDPVAAPSLEWAEGDNWTAAVALPPGQHAFKLVIVRSDGSPYWELGDDRSLQLPAIAADSSSSSSSSSSMAAAAAAPLMTVTCSWGNTGERGLGGNEGLNLGPRGWRSHGERTAHGDFIQLYLSTLRCPPTPFLQLQLLWRCKRSLPSWRLPPKLLQRRPLGWLYLTN